MITLTRFNSEDQIILNADLIESIEAAPDTIVTTITGKKIFVRETAEEVRQRVIHYRREIGAALPRTALIALAAGEAAA